MDIRIEKLEKEINSGDRHDRSFRWAVIGPNTEYQHFTTKKNATEYKRIRKVAKDIHEAGNKYACLHI